MGWDFAYCPDQPLGPTHPTVQMVLGIFLRVKRLGCGVEHTPHSSADVEERVEQYLYSPSEPSWHVTG